MSDIIFHIHLCGDNKKTNTLIAPYSKNYVHQILIFFVRNSFESTIEDRPVRIQQVDRHGRSKNSPTCFALLNVGFMIVLRRAG